MTYDATVLQPAGPSRSTSRPGAHGLDQWGKPRPDGGSAGSRLRARNLVVETVESIIESAAITPVFQPIFAASTGRIAGVEALSRFPGDEPPNIWFERAHRAGVGIDLEIAAIRAILRTVDDLPQNTYVACNASAATIIDARLHELIASSGCAHRIVIELTEHQPVDDYDDLVEAVEALRAIDVRISIDDVGAGFSSFAHVLRLRPEFVKIDMSLTRNNDSDPARRRVIGAIVSTAHHLGAAVVGEGVETTDEIRSLVNLGVTQLQGYALARPGPTPVPAHTKVLDGLPAASLRLVSDVEAQQLATTRFDVACYHSPIGMAVIDLNGRFLHVNPKLCEMLQQSLTHLETLTFQDVTHPDDLAADLELLQECLDGKRGSYRITKRYLRADGTHITAELTAAIIRSQSGIPLHFISQIQPTGTVGPSLAKPRWSRAVRGVITRRATSVK